MVNQCLSWFKAWWFGIWINLHMKEIVDWIWLGSWHRESKASGCLDYHAPLQVEYFWNDCIDEFTIPIASMYGISTYIYHKSMPTVGIWYTSPMNGMGYSIWRLQDFANLKSSFDGCICGPHTFHVAIKVDILNISSSQSVEKRQSIQIGRSCLNNMFEQHQFGHFLLPQKMGEFLKNLSPFPDLSPKHPWFPTRWAPSNSEIIRVPISPPFPTIRLQRFHPDPGSRGLVHAMWTWKVQSVIHRPVERGHQYQGTGIAGKSWEVNGG